MKNIKKFMTGSGVATLSAALVTAAFVFLPGKSMAQYSLSDGGSTATLNLGAGTGNLGMNSWTVLSGNQLNQQWFWYSVNGSAPQPINTIGGLSTAYNGANDLTVTYQNSLLSVNVKYTLNGNGAGSGSADIMEYIWIDNLSSDQTANVSFFQYSNFNLLQNNNNTVSISGSPGADKGPGRGQSGPRSSRGRCRVERRRRDGRRHRRDALRAECSHRHRWGQATPCSDSKDSARGSRNRRRLRPVGTHSGIHQHTETRPARRGHHRQPGDHRFPLSSAFGADPDSCAADRGHRDVYPEVLSADQLQHHVLGRVGAGYRRARRRFDRNGRKRVPAFVGGTARGVAERRVSIRTRTAANSAIGREAGRSPDFLLADHHRRLVPAGVPARIAGGTDVPAAGLHQVFRDCVLLSSRDHGGPGADGPLHTRQTAAARGPHSHLALLPGPLSAGDPMVPASSRADFS